MGLALYDESEVLMPMDALEVVINKLRTYHNGRNGGAYEVLLHLRNDDPAVYYHGLSVGYDADAGIDSGPLGNTGWSIKFSQGSRQPTEAEWDQVISGASLAMADIGATGTPDTSTYHPFWVRVYAPGETAAQLRSGQKIEVDYLEDVV